MGSNSKRDPSIHVKQSDLERILSAQKIFAEACAKAGITMAEATENIMVAARKVACIGRVLIQTTTTNVKKAVNAVKVDDEMCSKFNGILVKLRMAQNGRAGSKVMKDSAVQSQLRAATTAANDFCQEFEIDMDKGFRKFAEIGLKLMGRKYGLNKFASLRDKIAAEYHSELLVEDDDNAEGTAMFYNLWLDRLESESGVRIPFADDLSRYGELLLARMDADKLKADYSDWIEAQFAGLSFVNAVPTLSQIHGMTAQERYQKFMYTRSKSTTKDTQSLDDKLKGMKFINDEEREYYIKYVFKK